MPTYNYEAVDNKGKIHNGVVQADGLRQARSALRAKGLTPLQIDLFQEQQTHKSRWFGPKISSTDLAVVTRQMASLISSGLPIDQALTVLIEQADQPYIADKLTAIRAEVLSGHGLAASLSQHPNDFPDIFRAMVAAGEESGHLSLVMNRLADYIEKSNALSQKVKMAFIYPIVVTSVAIGIVIFLLTYVVPQVIQVFVSNKQKLPWLTELMVFLSEFFRNWWWLLLLLIVIFVLVCRFALKRPEIRFRWHQFLLNLPIVGAMILRYDANRFASTLAILTGAAVPILKSLLAAEDTMKNLVLKQKVKESSERVKEGGALSRALAEQKIFPPLLVHLIRSGEATGKVPEMLERAANDLGNEVERRTLWLTSLLEPALVLIMGGLVLLIVLAVLLPIIQINQMVR